MGKLRHIAISVHDLEGAAKFFVDVFEMKISRRLDRDDVAAFFLSDGTMDLALIHFKNPAGLGNDRAPEFEGLHHIGFEVEDIASASSKIEAAGFAARDDINAALGLGGAPTADAVEYKYSGPANIIVDVSQKGWGHD